MSQGLPITLTHLERRLCVLVGGGEVAQRKAEALLAAGARLRIVAPQLTDELNAQARAGHFEWVGREYSAGDLSGAFLVIAATDSQAVNRAVAQDANARGLLVNVVDDPQTSDFISPGVVRRGDLTIAVCTGGQVPALAAHLRARLEQEFGPEWEVYLPLLKRLRPRIAAQSPDLAARRQVWERVLEGDWLDLLRAGETQKVCAMIDSLLEHQDQSR